MKVNVDPIFKFLGISGLLGWFGLGFGSGIGFGLEREDVDFDLESNNTSIIIRQGRNQSRKIVFRFR